MQSIRHLVFAAGLALTVLVTRHGSRPLLAAEQPPEPEPGTILTIAGSGPTAPDQGFFRGDGGPALKARLIFPSGAAVDAAGNVYISDSDIHRVRKISPDGIITTVAGSAQNGQNGSYSGDGGPAIRARMDNPFGLAADRAGNLFIADLNNHRVRKVDTNGIITTVAGTGQAGFSGDGGPATQARLNWPLFLALDAAGNLFFSDGGNHRIRKVDTNGIITTVAGSGPAGVDPGGFEGDGGPATEARLSFPRGVGVDPAGNLYIADMANQRIRKVDTNRIITTVAGSGPLGWEEGGFGGDGGPATQARLNLPVGLALDIAGNLFIADHRNQRVRKLSPDGIIATVAGSGATGYWEGGFAGDGGPATQARLQMPEDVAVDAAGNLIVPDTGNHRVRKVFRVAAPGLLAGQPFP